MEIAGLLLVSWIVTAAPIRLGNNQEIENQKRALEEVGTGERSPEEEAKVLKKLARAADAAAKKVEEEKWTVERIRLQDGYGAETKKVANIP